MGKKWDSSGIAYSVELWQQCLRVLKPGGHLLSFGGTRTYHRVAVAIEDAGFELRDSIAWLYGSGFPKSLNIAKNIDKAMGVESEVVGTRLAQGSARKIKGTNSAANKIPNSGSLEFDETVIEITKPTSQEAQQWQGWGTALKPAFEPVIVARKPIEGTVANNVLKWGTGGLNIDGSRIVGDDQDVLDAAVKRMSGNSVKGQLNFAGNETIKPNSAQGRWPANIILDPYTAELLDEQSGQSKSASGTQKYQRAETTAWKERGGSFTPGREWDAQGYGDSGGASRFFYVAKASKRDRNEGLDELEPKQTNTRTGDAHALMNPVATQPRQNFHPTVKPTSLMEYLIKLVTPPNGTVLDPFTGSGSTGKAAILQGFDFIGIEMTEEYLPIIEGRLKHAEAKVAERIKETADQEQEKLF
jgi:site-specific DNA-methyltransferase (adenine-specific)